MNYPREELWLATGASIDHQARFSWQLAVYAILVATAIYCLCAS
jgi:hypothetical protein